jgi:hypothetical protein
MAKWILLNEVLVGSQPPLPPGSNQRHFPGETINDAYQSTAQITAAGGILWPATDPVVAAIAALAVNGLKLRGQGSSPKLSNQLLAGALYSLLGGSNGPALGPAAANGAAGVVQKASLVLGFAQCTAAALTQTFDVGAVLPADSRIIAAEMRIATDFSGGSVASATLSVGITGRTTDIFDAVNVFTGATLLNVPSTAPTVGGVDPFAYYASASQLIATLTTTTADVNALTAGALTVDVLYVSGL